MAEKKTKEKRLEELSKKIGDLKNASLNAYIEDLPHTFKRTGDYIITLAFERAEGVYEPQTNGDLEWTTPDEHGSMHVMVVIQDRDDKRFVPGLEIKVRLYTKDGTLVTESEAPYIWHPYAYHYGFDTMFLTDGEFYAEVYVKAPTFVRHHAAIGNRYADDVTVRLSPVELIVPIQEDPLDV